MYSIKKDCLYMKYVIEALKVDDIGKLMGCHGATIRRRLRGFNIPFRKRPQTQFPKYIFDKNWLYQKYIVEKLTSSEIAELKGCHLETVCRNLRKYDIPINKSGATGKRHPLYGKKGMAHPNWKGGKHKSGDGYILILNPEHPNANHQGYIFEHRLLLEKHLGRYLKPEERVHHINKKRDDNRIENFMLFSSDFSHRNYHRKLKEITNA